MKYIPIDLPGLWYTQLNQHLNKKEYGRLCRELAKPKYAVVKASEALKLHDAGALQVKNKIRIIWLHDIEAPCENWLGEEMAELEASYGLSSTHNVRIFSVMEKELLAPLKRIVTLGGEIQYQYEDLVATNGDAKAARKLFGENLAVIRKHFPKVNVAFAHGVYRSGIDATKQFHTRGKWDPSTWKKFGIHPCGELYYFMTVLCERHKEKFHYFGESKHLGADEFLAGLRTVELGDIVMFLQHPSYWSTIVDIERWKKCLRKSSFFKK